MLMSRWGSAALGADPGGPALGVLAAAGARHGGGAPGGLKKAHRVL